MQNSFLLFLAVTTTFAQNTTSQNGTNCGIVSNHTANPQISNPRLINVGDVVQIPNSKCVAAAAAALPEPTATCSNGTATAVTVVAGDTLIIIAKEKLGITLPALLAVNPQVTDPNKVNIGDVLNVPLCNAAAGTTAKNGTATASSKTSSGKAKATGSKRRSVYVGDSRRLG
ncbi:hypothetical protein LSUE1_G001917 [Lachnellula suecica]|uniref:LysM domain-containing protein n=1 Tax=Lachnellula suecica TaxID=602035 RepID=A0A8T9C9L3_9HELO|nr:hypothetical protein LSUE1_G001917 [Lachnellula suecica]